MILEMRVIILLPLFYIEWVFVQVLHRLNKQKFISDLRSCQQPDFLTLGQRQTKLFPPVSSHYAKPS